MNLENIIVLLILIIIIYSCLEKEQENFTNFYSECSLTDLLGKVVKNYGMAGKNF